MRKYFFHVIINDEVQDEWEIFADIHKFKLFWLSFTNSSNIIESQYKWLDYVRQSHILHYSFATHYYNESKDIKLICDLLGHANVSTTSEYLQLDAKEAMDKAFDLFSS